MSRQREGRHVTGDPKTMAKELRDIAYLLDEYEEWRYAPSDLRRIAAYLDTIDLAVAREQGRLEGRLEEMRLWITLASVEAVNRRRALADKEPTA